MKKKDFIGNKHEIKVKEKKNDKENRKADIPTK